MMKTIFTIETILKDLQEIYLKALEKKQYTVAFKIKELLGRQVGLFTRKNKENEKHKISLETLTDEDITRLIEELETRLKRS